jgi:hypothetical protein
MTWHTPSELVLSIYVTSKGFAFVLFEGAASPFDWGSRELRNPSRNQKCVAAIRLIIEKYHPRVLIIEDSGERYSRRTARIRRLYQSLVHLARISGMDVDRISKSAIRETFARVGAVTKHEIAEAIAVQIPAFGSRLPPVRKPWMSQDARQGLFDAVALAVTHYARSDER